MTELHFTSCKITSIDESCLLWAAVLFLASLSQKKAFKWKIFIVDFINMLKQQILETRNVTEVNLVLTNLLWLTVQFIIAHSVPYIQLEMLTDTPSPHCPVFPLINPQQISSFHDTKYKKRLHLLFIVQVFFHCFNIIYFFVCFCYCSASAVLATFLAWSLWILAP